MNRKTFAVLLSGCGEFDDPQVNEAALCLLALESNDIAFQCFVPKTYQYHPTHHFTRRVEASPSHVQQETTSIVMEDITKLNQCKPDNFDALIVPGGFGVAENFSNLTFQDKTLSIAPEVLSLLKTFRLASKPVGYLCIAPMLLPLIYGFGVKMALGNSTELIAIAEKIEGNYQKASSRETIFHERNRVISIPSYRQSCNLRDLKMAIDELVLKLINMS